MGLGVPGLMTSEVLAFKDVAKRFMVQGNSTGSRAVGLACFMEWFAGQGEGSQGKSVRSCQLSVRPRFYSRRCPGGSQQ